MTQNNEREAVVRWLRDQAIKLRGLAAEEAYGLQARADWNTSALQTRALARAIERGDHLENTNDTN